jgi:hypothetical protein
MLVTPELTLVRVADKEVLNEYATARTAAGASVDRHLKANLSQLLGFDQVGNDRKKRWEASDGTRGTFYNLADVSWFYHADIQEAIQLFGTAAAKHSDSLSSSMASQMVLTCSSRSLKAIALPEKDGFVTCRPQR